MPSSPPDFSLCQPKDILERLALPPPKDLDSLLLDATKPSSTRNNSDTRSGKQILRRASLPPFPWSHTINGCRTNPDAVKLLSNKSMCQGRWVKIPNTSSSPGTATGCFTNLESLAYNPSLIPSLPKCSSLEGEMASSSCNLRLCEQGASPLTTYSKAFNLPQGKTFPKGSFLIFPCLYILIFLEVFLHGFPRVTYFLASYLFHMILLTRPNPSMHIPSF